MPEMNEIVDAGVTAFEAAETRCRKAQEKTLALIPVFTDAMNATMMGSLETQQMIADAKAAAGLMAQGEAILWRLHRQATTIAQNNGVDIITPAGGPGR